MNKKIRLLLLSVLITLSALQVVAEPSTPLVFLMNEPASLLDFGLYLLSLEIEHNLETASFLNGKHIVFVSATYDWEKNRIQIEFTDWELQKTSKEAKEKMRRWIGLVRISLNVNPTTGKPMSADEHSILYGRYFSHNGYVLREKPENLKEELDQITEIIGHIKYGTDENPNYITATAPLLGTEIFFSE